MARCESCGMPFSRDPAGGGTEADGRRLMLYCSFCYDDGEFHHKGTDVRAYQAMVVENMVKNGWWRPIAWLVTREIPRLQRWRKQG